MANLLKGAAVAAKLREETQSALIKLKEAGINPSIGIIRVGERPDDVYYEGSIIKNCEKIELNAKCFTLPEDVTQDKLEETIKDVTANPAISGIFFFSPLPKHLDEKAARALIPTNKDIDCLTELGAAKIFASVDGAFPPCTPAAVMETLAHYGIPLSGKNVVVIGRSMVVGKPLAMLLLDKNATVTIAHSRTTDLSAICRDADIVIAAVGRAKMVNADYLSEGQTIIDVGINTDPDNEGKMCGDVDFDSAEPKAAAITPVPGGIGSVTTAVLLKHVVQAAARAAGKPGLL